MVSQADSKVIDALHVAFQNERYSDPRAAAETAYALATIYRIADVLAQRRFDLAKKWAVAAVDLLDALPSSELADVASTRTSVGTVQIPDLLHSDLIRERLADVLF